MENHPQIKEIRSLLRTLNKHGFAPNSVWDGGENVKVKTQKDAVDVIVSVDSSTLKVRNVETGKLYRLFIVLGNDDGEAVADYSDVDSLSYAVFEHYDRWCQ